MFLLVFQIGLASAEPSVLPPSWTEMDWIIQLTAPPREVKWEIETGTWVQGDTNVMPLSYGNRKVLPPIRFEAEEAYFTLTRLQEVAIRHGRWRLRYGYGIADLFRGTQGAAQLYLDARGGGIDPSTFYSVYATLNRSCLNRWSLELDTPFQTPNGKGHLYLTLHWLLLRRAQQGELSGEMVSSEFSGRLHLLSTRELPASETRGQGASLDVALILPLNPQWRAGIWVEHLVSRIGQPKVQEINAEVTTHRIEPDPDGFLHAVPLLRGRIEEHPFVTRAKPRWNFGLTQQISKASWFLFATYNLEWRLAVGYHRSLERKYRLWLLLRLQPFEWQVGLAADHWQLTGGASNLQLHQAQRATLRLVWSYPVKVK